MAKKSLKIETLRHTDARRVNIPTAEYESALNIEDFSPLQASYNRRNRDLDPQLVWRGKDEQDWSDLIVAAPPLYIQEKVHPKVLIDDLKRESNERRKDNTSAAPDLFGDFNGLKDSKAATEFYQHVQHWSNRMISGDSLAVMANLAEREGLRGKVQCIYFDPPYGIKFNSNFQWSTQTPKVVDGAKDQVTREPEQVKAFRDTWRDGVHSYLNYLRDRFTVARELLSETGSIFVQMGDENVHRVRLILDEVFGPENYITNIVYRTNSPLGQDFIPQTIDHILWFGKNKETCKYRPLYLPKTVGEGGLFNYIEEENLSRRPLTLDEKKDPSLAPKGRFYFYNQLSSSGYTKSCFYDFEFEGKTIKTLKNSWKTHKQGMLNLIKANRIIRPGKLPYMVGYHEDFPMKILANNWDDTRSAMGKTYVVETQDLVIQRCILMTTDPSDLVLDPTCGSGTTAYVAEQWGRRWITIDTSRVSLALARSRIMGARYPYYLLADSVEGQAKEAELTRSIPKTIQTRGDIRHGFVYERVPHIMLKDIANNTEIEVIYEKWRQLLDPLYAKLNSLLGKSLEEWELPRNPEPSWSTELKNIHAKLWEARVGRQKEIDQSINSKAESEYLYDKPYIDNTRVRVSGPFTVESLSPHRTMIIGADDELIDPLKADLQNELPAARDGTVRDYVQMVIENLQVSGVQQMAKADKINFVSLTSWAGGGYICAEGTYMEGDEQRRAAIVIGPEFGSLSRADLVAAAKEAVEVGFHVLIACAFNFDAAATELDRLGPNMRILKARMNPDLMMAKDLKTSAHGNLFVVFGEPDIEIHQNTDGMITVQVFGVDVFKPQTGEVVSAGIDGIALWMIDTDYNEESFFVRHAYFLGANDPYKSLKTTLKAEIDETAWSSLYSDKSRPFTKPKNGRIAVKVINHLGDEVMKVVNIQ